MNFFEYLKNQFNNRKYQNLREKYIKSFEKTGELGDIGAIQEVIKKIGIPSIEELNYGDEFDEVESIFRDNKEICDRIKRIRESEIISLISYKQDDFEKIRDTVFRYNDKYYKTEKVQESQKNICNSSERTDLVYDLESLLAISQKVIAEYEKHYNIIGGFSRASNLPWASKHIIDSFLHSEVHVMEGNTESISKKSLLTLTEDRVSALADKYLNEQDKKPYSNQNLRNNILTLISQSKLPGAQTFLADLDKIEAFEAHNINPRENINYIDAGNKEKVQKFNEELRRKKAQLMGKDFTKEDLVLVRTTDDFPYNKEFPILDEMNCDSKCSCNFIDDVISKILETEVGTDWYDKLDKDKEVNDKVKEMHDRYELVTTAYRSTKHFTLNGLVSSHIYGNFDNRSYIFLDPFIEHAQDDLMGFNEADTYFRVTREKPLKLSDKACIMIPIEKYAEIIKNPEMKKQLRMYKDITVFSGNEEKAVDMKLDELGFISENIGMWGFDLNGGFSEKMDREIAKIAQQNGYEIKVHYYSEEKKQDDKICVQKSQDTVNKFYKQLFETFGESNDLFANPANRDMIDEVKAKKYLDSLDLGQVKKFIVSFNEEETERIQALRKEYFNGKGSSKKGNSQMEHS